MQGENKYVNEKEQASFSYPDDALGALAAAPGKVHGNILPAPSWSIVPSSKLAGTFLTQSKAKI